jgi:hypothetical protein
MHNKLATDILFFGEILVQFTHFFMAYLGASWHQTRLEH